MMKIKGGNSIPVLLATRLIVVAIFCTPLGWLLTALGFYAAGLTTAAVILAVLSPLSFFMVVIIAPLIGVKVETNGFG